MSNQTEVKLNERELALTTAALYEHVDALERYCRWVDDRPMLPAREKAITEVRAEVRELRELIVKMLDARKPVIQRVTEACV